MTDADASRRLEAVERFDCLAYDNFNNLINDKAVELVVVALPSYVHADFTLKALAAGKHVVCEKPIAASPRPTRAAWWPPQPARCARSLHFQNRRYNPDFRKVRESSHRACSGASCQVPQLTESRFSRRWDWQTLRQFGGGSLNNTGPHFVREHDAATLWASRSGDSHPPGPHPDPGRRRRSCEAGHQNRAPTIDLEVSSCDAFPDETWHILGTQGGLHGSTRHLDWKFFNPADLIPRRSWTPSPRRMAHYNRDTIPWQEAS